MPKKNYSNVMNVKGILAVVIGFITGGFIILPLMFLGNLLPEKVKDHDLLPIALGILAGAMGMYLLVNYVVGDTWYSCLPSCDR